MDLSLPDPAQVGMDLGKPRLLMVTHRLPYPPDKGEKIRAYHMLRTLRQDFDVYLASLADEYLTLEAWSHLNSLTAGLVIRPLGRISPMVRALTSVAKGQSITEGYYNNTRLRYDITQWTKQFKFDAALAICTSVAKYVSPLDIQAKVLDLIDVDSCKWTDYAHNSKGPKSVMYGMEASRLAAYERKLSSDFHHVVVTTSHEADLYKQIAPKSNISVIENGVDTDYFQSNKYSTNPVAVFTGVLNYKPNVEGLIWLATKVWPRVYDSMPSATLKVVGRSPSKTVQHLARIKGIEIVGQVDDIRPTIDSACLSVAPLHIARGVQNKVLEAMAMGKCVLTTPKVAAGVGAIPGKHLLTAETADQWATTMTQQMRRPMTGKPIAQAGRRFVETNRTWIKTLENLRRLLLQQDDSLDDPSDYYQQAA